MEILIDKIYKLNVLKELVYNQEYDKVIMTKIGKDYYLEGDEQSVMDIFNQYIENFCENN